MGRRRRSREIALQVLYQIEMAEIAPDEAMPLFYELSADDEEHEFDVGMDVRPFAEKLIIGVELHHAELDGLITSASEHWRIERMSVVDRNILRIALFEMVHCPDIPPKVSINEAVDLGKTFGSKDSGKFINGVLDHILAELRRQGEIPDNS